MAADTYTHTLVTREADGSLRSTQAARVVDGLVVEMAGHFAYGLGTPRYHEVYEGVVAFEGSRGRTVEMVADGAAMHADLVRRLVF